MAGRRGLRDRLRPKLVRAVAEAVDPGVDRLARLLEERTAELRAEVAAARAETAALARDLVALEVRARRDVYFAGEVAAAASTSAFVLAELPTARTFPHPHETLRHALSLVEGEGLACEFGVASGTTLRIAAEVLTGRTVAGFDTFTGLPEAWRTGFDVGGFAQAELPEVPGAELVAGLFADTLPGWLAAHPGPVAYLHLDADLYSSTVTVLDLLADRLRPGTVVVFDEYFNYPGWQAHEHRAWTEFVARTGWRWRYEAYTHDHEQLVLVLTDRPGS